MSESLPTQIPIFPLPNTVLFPALPLPLHIFEPRYRAMMETVLESHRVIGMVLLKPGWEDDYEGNPPVFPVGCAGRVTNDELLPDGRYNLLLTGQSRFEIVSESVHERGFRLAEVRYLEEKTENSRETAQLRTHVLSVIRALARLSGTNPDVVSTPPPAGISDTEFVNFLSHIIELSALEKQALLEEDGTVDRYRKLLDILEFIRLQMERGPGVRQ